MSMDQDIVDLLSHGDRLAIVAHDFAAVDRHKLKHLLDPEPELGCRNGRIAWVLEYLENQLITALIHECFITLLGRQIVQIFSDNTIKLSRRRQLIMVIQRHGVRKRAALLSGV